MPVPDQQAPLRVGDVLHGFCGGEFGRDAYQCKRVEALGADWVVARDESGCVHTAIVPPERLAEYRNDREYCGCEPAQ